MNAIRKIPHWKRRIKPADVDRLIDRVNILSKMTGTGGISVSAGTTGVNIHNRMKAAGRGSYIMEVQSAAAGDGLYTCRKEKLLAAEWADEAGDDKFSDKAEDEYTILNLMENDPEPGYVAHLIAGSLLECWQMSDDGGTSRWVGIPVERLNSVRRAWVKDTPGAVAVVTCYLDVDTTGRQITVYCDICGGNALNDAVPRLSDGDEIYVENVGGTWRAGGFQASEDCECISSIDIDDVGDVTITTPVDDEVLAFDNGTSEWINQTPAEAGLQAVGSYDSTYGALEFVI